MASSKQAVKLPSSFFEVYLQYKASTGTVLEWLSKNGAITPQSHLTTNDLQGAVERIRDRGIHVPEAIYRAFKASISKRRSVTDWFSSAELEIDGTTTGSTANHIHYTEKLQAAFSTLFYDREEDVSRDAIQHVNKASNEAVPGHTYNRFEILRGLVDGIDDSYGIVSHGVTSQDISQHSHEKPSSLSPVLQDDPLETLIEIHLLLRELDLICETIKCYWEQASERILPLPVAAWLTNAGYEHAKSLCIKMFDIDKDAQEHQKVYVGVVNQLKIVFSSAPTDPKYDDFRQGRGMTFPWLAIAHFKIEWNENRDSLPQTGWQDPIRHISPLQRFGQDATDDRSDGLGKDLDAYKSLLTSIGELSVIEDGHIEGTGFVPSDMNPLLSDLSTFLKNDEDHPSLWLVFGVHLLLEVSKSFIWKNETATTTNCRLQALRFARDVKELVQMSILPTRDPRIAGLLEVDAAYLDRYLTEKRFDLYFQSPWTAGFHICEILHHSIDSGLRLCNSEGRVGAVLHMYNALRKLGSIDAVPLLDDLCELFKREVFLGSLPKENFSSNFRRFLGGGLQLTADSELGDSRQSQPTIGLPASLPTAQDYLKKFMPGRMSLFYELYNQHFRTTMDFWCRLYRGKSISLLSKRQRDNITEELVAKPFTEDLNEMRSAVLREFTGTLPVASVRYHAIFSLCQQVLTEMAVLKFEEGGEDVIAASTEAGFIFVMTLLAAIVEHQRDTRMLKMLPHLSSLHLARRAILKFCSGKQLADFVWEF